MMNFSGPADADRGIVAISNLFPNQYEPRRGLFNLRQFEALASLVPVTVVAPVPSFPLAPALRRFASSGRVEELPQQARVSGLDVIYPRYFYPPAVGRRVQGRLYYWGARTPVADAARRVNAMGLYGTWAYPDGFAVVRIARDLGVPCAIKVHGSDINDYMKSGWRRHLIVDTLNNAGKVVSVSEALKQRMIDCGVEENRIEVIYNGVDRDAFRVVGRASARQQLGLDADVRRILFVGNLKTVKAVDDLLEATHLLNKNGRASHLHIVGFGPLEAALRKRAIDLGLEPIVHFEGEKDATAIAAWMNACDLLVLPSLNEGVPNVVLEALACGTPVVATRVGGIPEIVESEDAGYLVQPCNPAQLSQAMQRALERTWDRDRVAAFAQPYSWASNARALLNVFENLTEANHAS